MNNSSGKLSFGFSKISKKPNLVKIITEDVKKVELIESIEGKELKVFGKKQGDDLPKKLIIPITDEQKSRPILKLIESRRLKKEIKKELENGNEEISGEKEETLEQRAAKEILEDLKNIEKKSEAKIYELPLHPDELPLNGATESTIDDYENVPISDFGKAMLRGMGWKEEDEKKDDSNKFDVPLVRPKGLGLGADKVVKKQKLLVNPAPNEILEIKRNAFVKILAGKHKNLYGSIEGFDDGGGRLIVKLAIGGLKVTMNEFMVQPISKNEFAKYSKILNSEKYEEFKNDEGKKNANSSEAPVIVKRERKSRSLSPPSASSSSRNRDRSQGRARERRSRSYERRSSKERSSHHSKKDERRRYSSDSEDDKTNNRKYNERRRSRSHDKHRKRYSSSDSNKSERYNSRKKSSKKSSKSKSKKYSSEEERTHKRKYKRSKHHRDRS